MTTCSTCGGSGGAVDSPGRQCPTCDGSGERKVRKVKVRITHIWCPDCESIQKLSILDVGRDETGVFVGTDFICHACRLLVTTTYEKAASPHDPCANPSCKICADAWDAEQEDLGAKAPFNLNG